MPLETGEYEYNLPLQKLAEIVGAKPELPSSSTLNQDAIPTPDIPHPSATNADVNSRIPTL